MQVPGGVTVVITGFSSTRDMVNASFAFAPATGDTFTSDNVSVPVQTAVLDLVRKHRDSECLRHPIHADDPVHTGHGDPVGIAVSGGLGDGNAQKFQRRFEPGHAIAIIVSEIRIAMAAGRRPRRPRGSNVRQGTSETGRQSEGRNSSGCSRK